jgi:colanic acid biosynthesis glycosyl transferase WcaI
MREGPRRILFFSYHLPRGKEPGAFRPWMEARLCKRAGYEVTVITSGVHYMTGKDTRKRKGWCTEEFGEGIRILKTWAPTGFRRSPLRRILNYLCYTGLAGLASLVKVGKVDRVFAGTDPIFMMPMVFLVSRLKSARLVLDERDLYPETAIALGMMSEGRLSRLLFRMQQFFRRKAAHLLAATPGIREKLLSYGHPEEKVQLLYNADVFWDDRADSVGLSDSLKQKTGKKFLVGYAGGLGKANDIPTLLRTAMHLRELDTLGIMVIGGGERLVQYREYCQQHGLHNVLFTGPVSRQQTHSWLGQMDVCVHLYPNMEIFYGALASKIFDYFGIGNPVIFCGRGDTVKLLAESGGGFTVPPEDDQALAAAIRSLLQNGELRQRLGTAARKWFEAHISFDQGKAIIQRAMNASD